ncbi:MAG: hypothetical protein KGZ68_11900 [Dechloromonas sp.]|nr:hypothetical protein [Dechloromonas sp.]
MLISLFLRPAFIFSLCLQQEEEKIRGKTQKTDPWKNSGDPWKNSGNPWKNSGDPWRRSSQ